MSKEKKDRRRDENVLGYERLVNGELNKGTAFSEEERERYRLRGLLPAHISNIEEQITRALGSLERKSSDIERFIFLQALLGRNEKLFYRLLIDHIKDIMPLIYTPTVGQACQEYAHIFRQPRGFYISPGDRGSIREILDNWPHTDIRMIVVTDGERILGLGDLGANGMGIPIGKLSLYTACAGIHPKQCLPVMLDVGTNNKSLIEDPLYLGLRKPRLTGDDYIGVVDEFVEAVQQKFPRALIQFEDFLTPNAYRLLNRYRDRTLCFNDDIQGTAAVALAGILASCKITDFDFEDIKILFLGAGSAATGIADLVVKALMQRGIDEKTALQKIWFVDSQGLLVTSREEIAPNKRPFAHDAPAADFHEAIETIQPSILIGATGSPGVFTEDAIRLMGDINKRPIIFALSNPTSRAECTAQQAYEWTDGRAVFASGSPFDEVMIDGKTLRPGQGNNAYIFPGIGLGAIACEAQTISDEMFLEAARVLAEFVHEDNLDTGTVYPSLEDIREVSKTIAITVAEIAWKSGLATIDRPHNIEQVITDMMYDPNY